MSTAREEAGRLLIVGIPGLELDAESRRILQRTRPGGVILFARNVGEAAALRELVHEVRRAVPRTLLYVDAEGGRVDRFRSLLGPGVSGRALAAAPPQLAERAGRWMGYGLRLFDCDVDLAPVVDLDVGEVGNALDERYLGADSRAVTARARAFLRGLHAAGVGGCIKHYPGLGAARADTHDTGAVVALDRAALAAALEPFRRLGRLAGAMMASHAGYPALDPSAKPAGLSPAIAATLLRRELRFRGVLFSDDLDMHALDEHGTLPQRAAAALAAGCDGLFVCQSLAAVPEIAERLARPALAQRRHEALERLDRYRRRIRASRRQTRGYRLETVRDRLAAVRAAAGE